MEEPPPPPFAPPPPPPAPPASAPAPVALGTQVPTALIAGLVVLGVGRLVVAYAFWRIQHGGDFDRDAITRWSLLSRGLTFAFLALALTGAHDLVRRASGRSLLGARIVLGSTIALFVAELVQQYVQLVYAQGPDVDHATVESIWEWSRRFDATAWVALTAGLVVVAMHARITRVLAVPLVLCSLVAHPFDLLAERIGRLLSWSTFEVVSAACVLGISVLAILMLRAAAPMAEHTPGWGRAGAALDRAASALYARIWIAISGAFLVLMLFGSRGEGGESLAKLWMVGVPLANAIAGIVLVTGVMGASSLAAPRAPRVRLLVAGTALAITVAITSVQVVGMLRVMLGDRDGFGGSSLDELQALPVLLPLIALVGMAALVWGLHGIADALGSDQLKEQASTSLVTVVICNAIALAIPYALANMSDTSPANMLSGLFAVAVASVIALVSVARLCRALATGLRAKHELPVAQLFA